MSSAYKYACAIYGHTSDVRCVTPSPLSHLGIISSSRDFSARIWEPDNDGKGYHQSQCYEGHTNFVFCVTAVGPSDENPEGLVFTGSGDKIIRVFGQKSSKPLLEMKGHTDAVCALYAGKFNMVVSGSWDKTSKVWVYNKNESTGEYEANNVMTLSGHDASIWAVLILDQGIMATGSADKTIKLWKAGKCVKTLKGHDDCVRGLAMLTSCQFLSCANDATVRRWTTIGECLQVYYGHTSYIYSVSVLPGEQEFVTSSEDRSLRVWNIDSKDPIQSIALPAQSAWNVTALQNGDLVAGLSDSTIRIFSRSEERIASAQEIAGYEAELSSARITEQGNDLGDVDINNTPGIEALDNPGKKDGQVQLVRVGERVEAHQWSMSEQRWMKVGDVVGGKNEKKVYNGKEYDFVFDVDIQEGLPPLKLPYNLSEDAWFAAQKFIDDNELSQDFLEQIADFILENTKNARGKSKQGETSGPVYSDPFTGGGRYVPQDSTSNASGGRDPFTGSGRYIPSGTDNVISNDGDPFTSGGRYVPGEENEVKLGGGAAADPMINPDRYIPGGEGEAMDTSVPVAPAPKVTVDEYFPKKGFITFGNANIDTILGKLRSFSPTCGGLTEEELSELKALCLPDEFSEASRVDLLWKALKWPAENLFPVLDILRLACLKQPDTCRVLCSGLTPGDNRPSELLDLLCSHIASPGKSKHESANRLLSLRTLCNLFESPDGAAFLTSGHKEIFQALSTSFSAGLASDTSSSSSAPFHGNKNVQIAAATFLLNFSVLCANVSANGASFSPLVRKMSARSQQSCVEICVVHLVAGENSLDPESIFRYLVCLGTLLNSDRMVEDANNIGALKVVESTAAMYSSVKKIHDCSINLLAVLNSH